MANALDFDAMLKAERKAAKARRIAKQSRLAAAELPAFSLAEDAQALGLGIHYASSFLTLAEAEQLSVAISGTSGWTELPQRYLLNLGGIPHPSGMIAEELPAFLSDIASRLRTLFCGQPPNQALINRYEPGGGISAHADGPLYLPTAAIVSLLSPCVICFTDPRREGDEAAKTVASVWLEPRSLLVFRGEAYESLHHSISPLHADRFEEDRMLNRAVLRELPCGAGEDVPRGPRISLTLRRAAKVQCEVALGEVLPPELEEERLRRQGWWRSAIGDSAPSS